ncbi:LacI family DNA-binding transcriptional regulator [Klenkia taihuensis]|uniref:Transcriptional regulator, LacI family n=1 Tax=Klenkia taihuensis TaxID=1225127 RepID=A0A1I1GG37_9ACTN|nr:LacI family DNA-binding transcriptional regulator [Klenkia taihuensis]GHE09878.1 LacI family transcriptional regulator [Klenkia taihuensis]SFC08323.1 transcriptional regulator, LacI family [Klenkia taihuensis]
MTRPPRRARAVDVAARAGVSVATVSFVVNGKAEGRVSPATRLRVLDAIAALGYVTDASARALATGRRRQVALLAHDMTNPFTAQVAAGAAAGIAEATEGTGHLLLLLASDDAEPDTEPVGAATVDGVLINYPGTLPAGRPDLPVVHLDDPAAGGHQVSMDVTVGARELAAHLADLGHRHVVFLDSNRPWSTFAERRTAFTGEFTRRVPGAVVTGDRSGIDLAGAVGRAAAALEGWLGSGATAVVTATDVQALGVLSALATAGVPVPGRLSVAAFDDIPFAAVSAPPLTTVALPARELGHRGAVLLSRVIDGTAVDPAPLVLPAHLVVRGSTGPP